MNILLEYEYLTLQVKNEIKKKLRNLDKDSKLEFKKAACENSKNYANLTSNIHWKSHKLFTYETFKHALLYNKFRYETTFVHYMMLVSIDT